MSIKSFLPFALCLSVLLFSGSGFSFEQEMLQRAYDTISPALCVLTFTQETTDPRSGEQIRQNGFAVALNVSAEGLLLTNGHLQRDNVQSFNFRVTFRIDGKEQSYPAVLLKKPDDLNVSLLRLQSETPLTLPYVRFSTDAGLSLGEPVAILGIMGETLDFNRAIQEDRIISVLDAPRSTYCLGGQLKMGFVTGPVINRRGQVVGITGFDLAVAEGGEFFSRSGVPLVYQASLFEKHIASPPDQTQESVEAEEAWLGVFTQPLKEEFARYWNIPEAGGLIVSTVIPDSPAAAVGIVPGDIIRAFDGHPIRAIHDRDVLAFTQMVKEKAPGSEVEITLLRNGEDLALTATLGHRPRAAQDADEYEDEHLGMVVREITRDLRILLNLGEEVQGVIVRRVVSGSAAQAARIQPGLIIMSMNSATIRDLDDYKEAAQFFKQDKPDEITLFVRAGAQTGFLRLRPRW
ncbi:MAG TPA: PDZ domain-containing protein [Candidatus Hydrogenedentes bacterium]|jgi:serine protease Do|nr:PDZ domain-containing protein [Candidatus Hydrogenedentota bacterium]